LQPPRGFQEGFPDATIQPPVAPRGALAPRRVLEGLLACSSETSMVVVDEAFMDFTSGEESLLGSEYENVLVLRSFTKIYSIQGLRAGFLYTGSRRLARLVDSFRQPWNVNSLAAEVVVRILEWEGLEGYIRRSVETVAVEREFLAERLKRLGLKVYDSQAPFMLVEHKVRHPELNERLLARGFYVRDASTFEYLTPHHSRISVKLRNENEKLVEVLAEVLA